MSYRVLKSIEMDLSSESITQAIREVGLFQQQLRAGMNALVAELVKQGTEVAKMQVVSMDAVDTGDLEKSIYGYFSAGERIGYIFAPTPYAFYVEYGTGNAAMSSPHPEQGVRGVQYDQNAHGLGGWFYPSDKGWILTKNGTMLAWTRGMPARPFMHNTMKWLEEAARTIARSVLV